MYKYVIYLCHEYINILYKKKNRMKEVKEKRKISYDTYIIIRAKLDYTK